MQIVATGRTVNLRVWALIDKVTMMHMIWRGVDSLR